MTHQEYALYSQLFDTVVALRTTIERTASIQSFGAIAGAALRTWAAGRRLDVVPEIRENPHLGSWTTLRVTLPDDISWCIVVHLEDYLRLDAPAAPPVEMENPF